MPRVRRLRTGYKILEIFTWSCLLSRFAYGLGWEYLEPLTLPGWDLKSPKVEKEAWDYLHRVNPDFITVAWPCTEWTITQNANQKTWTQKQALLARRVEARKLLRFTRRVTLWQARSGRAILGENPLLSLAWEEPDIIDAFGHLDEAICDQCQYGLRHPENGVPIKKPTRFVGQAEVVSELHHRCPGDHQHHQIEGTVKTSAYGRISLSSWGRTLTGAGPLGARRARCPLGSRWVPVGFPLGARWARWARCPLGPLPVSNLPRFVFRALTFNEQVAPSKRAKKRR